MEEVRVAHYRSRGFPSSTVNFSAGDPHLSYSQVYKKLLPKYSFMAAPVPELITDENVPNDSVFIAVSQPAAVLSLKGGEA